MTPVSQRRFDRLVFIAVFGITITLTSLQSTSWLGDLRATLAITIDCSALSLLVVLVVSAYSASQSRRRGQAMLESTTRRASSLVYVRCLKTGSWGALGVLAALSLMLARDIRFGSVGMFPLWWLLPTFALSYLLAGLGALVGHIIAWPPLTLLLAPVGWGVVGYALRSDETSALITLQARASAIQPFTKNFILSQTVFYLALSVLTTLLALRRLRRVVIALALSASLLTGGWLARLPASDRTYIDEEQLAVACSSLTATVQFCWTRSEANIVAELQSWALEGLNLTIPIDIATTRIVTERAALVIIPNNSVSVPGTAVMYPRSGFDTASAPRRIDTLESLIVSIVNPQQCPLNDRYGETPIGAVLSWYLSVSTTETQGVSTPSGQIAKFLRESPEQTRTDWLKRNMDRLQSCQKPR